MSMNRGEGVAWSPQRTLTLIIAFLLSLLVFAFEEAQHYMIYIIAIIAMIIAFIIIWKKMD